MPIKPPSRPTRLQWLVTGLAAVMLLVFALHAAGASAAQLVDGLERWSSGRIHLQQPFAAAPPLAAVSPISADQRAALVDDVDVDGLVSPGDTLEYTVVITNGDVTDALGVVYSDTIDANTTLSGTVRVSPIGYDDSYDVLGNTAITITAAGGLLGNDIDPDGGTLTAVVVTGGTTSAGGDISISSDGSFSYDPPAGHSGTDTFAYTVQDSDGLQNTGIVTFTIDEVIWYVDDSAAAGGDGRQSGPFNSLTSLNGSGGAGDSDGSGDIIFLYSGSYSGGIGLESSQQLIGQGVDLATAAGLTVPTGSSLPGLSTAPSLFNASGNGVDLADENTIRGLIIGSTSGTGIVGSSVGMLTISSVTIDGTGGLVSINGGMLNVTFNSLTSTGGATNGIYLNNVVGSFYVTTIVSIDNPSAAGINVQNSSAIIWLPGLYITGAGGDGLVLANHNGDFTSVAGYIFGANGTAVNISQGNGNVTLSSSISNITNRSVVIQDRTGGTSMLSGDVSDSGTGILVSNNSGGSITFSGASKIISTGPNAAVTLTNNSGATVSFTNGGLDIDTTSGTGFSATGGGTITVTGNGNTIDTALGTALNIANTTISASGLTFTSISADGAANGIVLNTTGTLGGLTVLGDGSTTRNNSGGTLANTTGDAVSLTATAFVQLNHMEISNPGRHAVSGSAVSGNADGSIPSFGYRHGSILNAGNGDEEHALFFNTPSTTNVTGLLLIDNTLIQGFVEKGLVLSNNSGSLTVQIQNNSRFENNHDTIGNEAIRVLSQNSASITLNVLNTTFDHIEGNAIAFEAESSGINDANIVGNSFSNGGGPDSFPLGSGIDLIVDRGQKMTFNIQNNTFTAVPDDAIVLLGEGDLEGRITNNNISLVNNSGSFAGDGIRLDLDGSFNAGSYGALDWTILIQNNTINLNGEGDDGIQVLNRDHTGTLNLTIEDNTIFNSMSEGIRFFTDDDLSLGPNTPASNVRLVNNSFTNTGLAGDDIILLARDTARGCFHLQSNNNGSGGAPDTIWLDQLDSSVLQITQASTAALSSQNFGASVTANGSITFNGACINPVLPSNDSAPGEIAALAPAVTAEIDTEQTAESEPIALLPTTGIASATAGEPALFETGVKDADRLARPAAQISPDISVGPFNLPAGKAVTITFQVTIDSPFPAGVNQVQNQGEVTGDNFLSIVTDDPDTAEPADPTITNVAAAPDLLITKDDDGISAEPGQTITYTLTYSNTGNQHASGVVITETVPANTSFNVAASSAGWTGIDALPCPDGAAAGTVCTLAVGDVTSGSSDAVTFGLTVVDRVPAGVEELSNVATIADDGSGGSDPDGNNSAGDTTPVLAAPDLQLNKDDGGQNTFPGGVISYTLTFTNAGNQGATGVVITDVVPANTSFTTTHSSPGWSCLPDNNPGSICSYTVGSLDGSDTATFAVQVGNGIADGTLISNTACINDDGGNGTDSNLVDNCDTEITTAVIEADLQVTMTEAADPVTAGSGAGNLTYVVTVENLGPSDVTGVVLSDTLNLPAGVTRDSITPSGGTSWSSGSWTVGDLPAGDSETLTIVLTVGPAAATGTDVVTNAASITTVNERELNSINNSAVESTSIDRAVDITVGMTESADPITAGSGADNLTYVVTATNNGPSDASGVVLTDTLTLPTAVTRSSITPSGDTTWSSGTWTVGDLPAGSSETLTLVLTVGPAAAPGTDVVANEAAVTAVNETDDTSANNNDQEATSITTAADLVVGQVDSPDPVTAGHPLSYTVTITNNGPSDAQGVVLTDTLPAGVTFINAPDCNEAAGLVTCEPGTIAAGGVTSYTVAVSVNVDALGPLSNSVVVTSDTAEATPGNESDTEETTVAQEVDLSLEQTESIDPVVAGSGPDNLTYVITATNNGPSQATNITITDTLTLPSGVSISSITPSTGNWNGAAWTIPALNPGSSAILTITLTVGADTAVGTDLIGSTASITGADQALVNPGDDTAAANTSVTREVDLVVTLTESADPITAGSGAGNLTYVVTVTNSGPSDASGVILTDTLDIPSGVTLDSVTPSGTTNWDGASESWTVGTLASGDSETLTLVLTLGPATAPGTDVVANAAALVAVLETDSDDTNDSAAALTSVSTEADLLVSKSDDPDPVVAGETLTYTVSITNNGPSDAQGVVLTDTLPAEFTLSSYAGCNESSGVVVCPVGTVAAGDTISYTIVGLVDSTAGSSLTNTVTISAGTAEAIPGQESDTEETTVVRVADLEITKADDPDPAIAGQPLTYTLTVTNHGPSEALGVAVVDTLPSEFNYQGNSCGASASPGTVNWTINTMAPDAVVGCVITGTIDSGVSGDISNQAVVSVAGTITDPNPDNNSANEITTVYDNLFSISDVTQAEGDSNTTAFTFTISRTTNASASAIDYQTADGTAVAGSDYTAGGPTTVNFDAGGTLTQTITISVTGDLLLEQDETFQVNLSNPTSGAIDDGEGIATILNDDPLPALSLDQPSAAEASGQLTFTVSLDAVSGLTTTVAYTTTAGTALDGTDYTGISGTLTIPAGDTSGQVGVPLLDDALYEFDETVTLTLSDPVSATISGATGTGTIIDDETAPSLAINDVTLDEAAGTAVFTVTLDAASARETGVSFATSDGTATAPDDYSGTSSSLTIPAGWTVTTITVSLVDDLLDELNETFTVTLSSPVNATLADGEGIGTLTDNDPTPELSIGDVTVDESTGTAVFTVTLDAPSGLDVTVDYTTVDDSAAAPDDYTTISGTLTIPAGETQGNLNVPILDDQLDEITETVTIDLTNPVYATLAEASAVGTITDNDTAVVDFSSAQYAVMESSNPATVTVTLSIPAQFTITVDYASSDGTALGDTDYTPISGTLTFAPGATEQALAVPILDDTLDELDETITMTLASAISATLGANNPASVTVIDNDGEPSVGFSSFDYGASEAAGSATISVTLSNLSGLDVTVELVSSNGTAIAGADYVAVTDTLTIPAGQTVVTYTVPILDDTLHEADETVMLGLRNPTEATIGGVQPATLTLRDDDPMPNVQFSDVAYATGEADGSATLTVTLSAVSALDVTVDLSSSDGTAVAGEDYTAVGETVTIPAGQTVVTLTIPILADNLDELDETVELSLSNPVEAGLAAPDAATLTIIDDDTIVYLPALRHRLTALPDLVVADLLISDETVQVVVQNQGQRAVTDPFWVDLYFNPDPPPAAVNETWPQLAGEGLVWGVAEPALPLLPGETVTLTLGGPYYEASLSHFSGSIAAGTPVYVQVDSAHLDHSYGAVRETHEATGQPYNNILGPVSAPEVNGLPVTGSPAAANLSSLYPSLPPRRH